MRNEKVRFAVVGLGNIAQMAVLPAFAHAARECELAALISSDPLKRKKLAQTYGVEHVGDYDDLEQILERAEIDAAYIALPNSHHREFTERCARSNVHVLCEKPMANTVEECEAMLRVCDEHDVKLMIAYRLHFDPCNLQAIEIAQSGKLGDLLMFSSTFGHQARGGGIRTKAELGGGALFDMGIYCVNAARYIFQAEPEEVFALQSMGDERFEGVDATTAALLRFPGDRFAQLTASQASADSDQYRVVGSKGELRVEPAFTYYGEMVHHVMIDGSHREHRFEKSDQFAPELLHFARCIVEDVEPEPSGEEGLADVRILEALLESARSRKSVRLAPFARKRRPGTELAQHRPPVRKRKPIRAPSPSE